MFMSKSLKEIKQLLGSLTITEKMVVVGMLAALLHHQEEETSVLIIGIEPKDLKVPGMDENAVREECEKLVEKGVFMRQLGDADPAIRTNAPVSQDEDESNWYSFHLDFIEELDKYDLYVTLGYWVGSMALHLPPERQELFFTEATRSLLQGTYL
jgi:hypothetical protein